MYGMHTTDTELIRVLGVTPGIMHTYSIDDLQALHSLLAGVLLEKIDNKEVKMMNRKLPKIPIQKEIQNIEPNEENSYQITKRQIDV